VAKPVVTLPDKPSALILLALRDLALVEKDKRYAVDMNNYHFPYGKKCAVCFAGAVMAKTFRTRINTRTTPFELPYHHWSKLLALDCLRLGRIREGLMYMDMKKPRWIKSIVAITDYILDPRAFRKDMEALAMLLASHGL
jgi:hypothetical protein